MKYAVLVFIFEVYLSLFVCANNLYIEKEKGSAVYTNISKASFFTRAFSIGKTEHFNKQKIMDLIEKTALRFNVSPKIAISIAKVESDFNHNTVSRAGASGVMQLMKKTAKYYGVKNINNLKENIEGGVRFLKHLIKKYSNIRLVAAAYNAGETAVDKYKGIPPFAETQRYVRKFMEAYTGKSLRNKPERYVKHKPIKKICNIYSNIGNKLW